jgi:hypothetical protein
MPSIIVYGASGYVGGMRPYWIPAQDIARLTLSQAPYIKAIKQAHPDWPVTAYVRSTQPETELKATLKADRIAVGTFDDFEGISALSKEHDISVNAGNSFTGDLVAAIIAGQKSKVDGPKGKLIHVSGAGNWIDYGTSGNFNPESKVWSDVNEDDIKAIHKDMFNGQSDTLVLEAGAENDVDTYIVCPSVVYGGADVSASTLGVGYSLLTGNSKPLGYVPYVGDGTAVVSTVSPTHKSPSSAQTITKIFRRSTSST